MKGWRGLGGLSAEALAINADATGGSIKVELLNPQGYRVRGYSLNESAELKGDSFAHAVSWQGVNGLPSGRHLIRIHLYKNRRRK